ncbi:folylpolyglutamate synthase/dihydrofolate synthase family protein [soil metagenome]
MLTSVNSSPATAGSYDELLKWLFGTQRFGIKLGLENIRRLLHALGVLGKHQRIIHVAGTNGKGSTCAMIDAISREQGYRTGLFTSPHLVSFRERIRVNGVMIGKADVAAGLATIRDLTLSWDPHPTFFEIATALALQHFQQTGCEVVVLETGMGGRLDATNAITPVVSVITPVALDHQKWLGETIEEIAGEKAGIIKPEVPVVSAAQQPRIVEVLRAKAAACEAPLEFVSSSVDDKRINLAGEHQQQNAALAVAAIHASGIAVKPAAITAGLANVSWPARFQRWNDNLVIDGAHNPAGAKTLVKTWRGAFGDNRAVVILATLRDKDTASIVAELAPITARVILPQARAARALSPVELAATVSNVIPTAPCAVQPSLTAALAEARESGFPILITGSLHFAGEALALLENQADQLEDCLQ